MFFFPVKYAQSGFELSVLQVGPGSATSVWMNARIRRTKHKPSFTLIAISKGSTEWNELYMYTSTHLPQLALLRCWKSGSKTSVLKHVPNRCLSLGRKRHNNKNRKAEEEIAFNLYPSDAGHSSTSTS